jgi:glyoxylase-like metal-dependent hydrolase (beta-lactamase superfamily II)
MLNVALPPPPPRAIRDGLWHCTLPLPFELNHVNITLVRLKGDSGWMLVDTGLGSEDSYDALLQHLDATGVPLHAITEIFLTHTHPDHVGNTARLLVESSARLTLQHDELLQVHNFARSPDPPLWLDAVLVRAGVPTDLIHRIEGSFAKIRSNFPDLHLRPTDRIFAGGEIIDTAIGPLLSILTPGHSPGHLCLYSPDQQILLSGDHVLESITPNIGWLENRDALGEFETSLQRIARIPASLVLPGHGVPFSGHVPWAAATWQHHEERCAQIREALQNAGPRTAHQLVGSVWTRPLAPFHHRFAVFEVLSHLEYMRRRGQVTVCEGPQAAAASWAWSEPSSAAAPS